ncbi:hypothetical protein HG535_0H00210 [Zygotorulaspora mrakii]|uniref:Uncharacterized protein n=1 Tax=Zygotorulaspora mrakii TaxID=42260 RepID=A0A7H9B8L3_ZYGMR|nr:uncharacterized protein HG535_0H00210 [Zygotorulaspora mrakii]QLG74696.1 hypothetical protein HG535_0H00210 [Zygotorulaspora mrakii]
MSSTGTPTQHNSTLAISPFVSGRNGRYNASQAGRAEGDRERDRDPNTQQLAAGGNGEDFRSQEWNPAGLEHNHPYGSLANSPLVQKTNPNIAANSLATPHHHVTANTNHGGLIGSISKNGLFGSAMPSTLRKVSLQREYRDPLNTKTRETHIESGIHEPMSTTTTLTTTTTATTSTAEFDISELSSIEKLRLWRHDALMQHLYKTAEFVANKIYTLTGDPNDAFWLAQVYFSDGSYVRAIDLLSRDMLDSTSIMCRYLKARCLVKLQKYDEALDIVGECNPFSSASDEEAKKETDGGIKLESSLCYLRGIIYSAQNNFAKAKESFKEAVLVDVKNFEAFEELTSKNLLTPREEWDLLESLTLDFSILDDNQDMVKNLYIIRLSKYLNEDKTCESRKQLIEEHNLASNVDILVSDVETLYTKCKFSECLNFCETILEKDKFNAEVLPTYIACFYELGMRNKLFLLSHELAENFPKNPITWFSVATYYMVVNKIGEARKYFSKSSILDPNFAPSWLGFAHTYSMEGEQDQAVSAYSTAARFFPGIHLPNLFLGMQYMSMNTLSLAEEYFTLAYDICPQDPLLLNEMGVMFFKRNELQKSKRYLKKALEAIIELDSTSRTFVSIQINLAHAYRKMGDYERAIKCFKFVLEVSGKDSDIYCSLGFLYLKTKQLQKAIDHLHTALSLSSTNHVAQELLLHALELNVSITLDSDHPLVVNAQIHEAHANIYSSRKRAPLIFDSSALNKKMKTSVSSQTNGECEEMEIE